MDITVRRANVLLTIPEDQKSEYLAKGFDVIDTIVAHGNLLYIRMRKFV